MALEGFKRRVLGSIGLLKGKRKVDQDTVKDLSKSLRRALLEADFNVRQAKELTERVERGILEEEPRPGVKLETHAMNLIYSELVRILGPPREIKPHNQTVLMVGLYGQERQPPPQNWQTGGERLTEQRLQLSKQTCIGQERSNN